MIKWVVFDIDNTIYDYDFCHEIAMAKLEKYACEKYNISSGEFNNAFSKAKAYVKDNLGSTGASHNRMLYMQRFLENIGEKPVCGALGLYDTYWDTMLENMVPFGYVVPLMKELNKRGIHIAALTNLTAYIQHRKLKQMCLDSFIEAIVSSEEAGKEKPSDKAFKMILSKTNAKPEETMMIGDSLKKDIIGAKNAGMHGMLFEKEKLAVMEQIVLEYIKNVR